MHFTQRISFGPRDAVEVGTDVIHVWPSWLERASALAFAASLMGRQKFLSGRTH